MEHFHTRLETKIKKLRRTFKSIDEEIGKKPGYTSNMIAGRNDPGGSVIATLAKALGTTPNDLMGITGRFQIYDHQDAKDFIDQQALALVNAAHLKAREHLCAIGGYPPVQEVYKWAMNCSNVVDTTEEITKYFTTYASPPDYHTTPKAKFVGPDSLAKNSLGTVSAGELNDLIKKMPDQFVQGLARDQFELEEGVPRLSCERIPVNIPDAGVDVDFKYLRLYMRLRDRDGTSIVLNYSEPLD